MVALQPIPASEGFRYLALAQTLESSIRDGTFRAGERLPSIRELHHKTRLSISTVYQALIELEKRGLIDPRPKSGYYVKPLLENILPSPQTRSPRVTPSKVTINNLAFAVLEAMGDPDILQLGGSVMAPGLMPVKALAQSLKTTAMEKLAALMAVYEHPMGHIGLRRQIAQRHMEVLKDVSAEDILTTNGCFEAVAMGLQAVAAKGDIIVVESPTFPWYLQLIEDLGMLALEIPTDPKEGIDLDALQQALARNPVKACIFNTNFQNPLGFLPSDEKKRALVKLLNAKEIPVIEDDIYAELYFGRSRPIPLKAFDTKGLVLYCGSFSKTVSPGLRVGWCMPGIFIEKVKRLKLYVSISSPTLTQEVLSQYMQKGNFDRHLRKLRTTLQRQMADMTLAIARYFPEGTRMSTPQGGLTLWVQLKEGVDSLELFRRALEAKIAVFPGVICANSDAYRHCIRISCGLPYDHRLDQGLQTLARIVRSFY
ncbi:MAG: PLP-dependent aminotransferase family protein [Desulfobacteraceae bacterium]|nr:PLP-dependent aminotransferase family protein [Desulfobacteraceae bacterium]